MKNFVSQITTAILRVTKQLLRSNQVQLWDREEWRLQFSLYRFSRLHKPWKRY